MAEKASHTTSAPSREAQILYKQEAFNIQTVTMAEGIK
jgi:hypothetical protein